MNKSVTSKTEINAYLSSHPTSSPLLTVAINWIVLGSHMRKTWKCKGIIKEDSPVFIMDSRTCIELSSFNVILPWFHISSSSGKSACCYAVNLMREYATMRFAASVYWLVYRCEMMRVKKLWSHPKTLMPSWRKNEDGRIWCRRRNAKWKNEECGMMNLLQNRGGESRMRRETTPGLRKMMKSKVENAEWRAWRTWRFQLWIYWRMNKKTVSWELTR